MESFLWIVIGTLTMYKEGLTGRSKEVSLLAYGSLIAGAGGGYLLGRKKNKQTKYAVIGAALSPVLFLAGMKLKQVSHASSNATINQKIGELEKIYNNRTLSRDARIAAYVEAARLEDARSPGKMPTEQRIEMMKQQFIQVMDGAQEQDAKEQAAKAQMEAMAKAQSANT